MAEGDVDVVIVGGGAAGLAAARRLCDANVSCLLIEARSRLGGRAWSITATDRLPRSIVGCGWLHSADRNPWSGIAQSQGRRDRPDPAALDKTCADRSVFPLPNSVRMPRRSSAFHAELETAEHEPDRARGCVARTGWSVEQPHRCGQHLRHRRRTRPRFGARPRALRRHRHQLARGRRLRHADRRPWRRACRLLLDCPVQCIDHSGMRLADRNHRKARSAPTGRLSRCRRRSWRMARCSRQPCRTRRMPRACLPLGLDDKLFLSLEDAGEFEKDSRLFGRTDRRRHRRLSFAAFRPAANRMLFWRLAGRGAGRRAASARSSILPWANSAGFSAAASRAGSNPSAFMAGAAIRSPAARIPTRFLASAECRETLARPVDDRLFFAGEACSRHDYSTAHGGLLTGLAAADQVLAARKR